MLAHRRAWEEASGAPIPLGMVVLHTCDNPPCIRNDGAGTYEVNGKLLPRFGHLALGTLADNMADRDAKGRQARGDKHWTRLRPGAVVRQKGEAHGMSKLDTASVLDIRKRVARGEPQRALARAYGVRYQQISRIVRRERWAHV